MRTSQGTPTNGNLKFMKGVNGRSQHFAFKRCECVSVVPPRCILALKSVRVSEPER